MTDKMTVLLVKDTKHIVGVVTRVADPEAKLKPQALAGDSVLIRYAGDPTTAGYDSEFLVPSEALDVLVADFDRDVIASPRTHIVDDQNKVAVANSVITASSSFPNDTQVQVTLSAATPSEAKVLVLITGDDPDDSQTVTGKIAANGTDVTMNIEELDTPATYHILTFVQGFGIAREDVARP